MEKYKEELFPTFEGKEKIHRKRFKGIKLVRERYIKLSEDKIALILLVFLGSFLLSYVLGYRKGTSKLSWLEKKEAVPEVFVTETREEKPKEIHLVTKTPLEKEDRFQYAVQVVAYKNPQLAETEKRKLEKQGYQVFVVKGKKYIIVYVGKYQAKEEAEKTLKKLRTDYKDAFIKKLSELNNG